MKLKSFKTVKQGLNHASDILCLSSLMNRYMDFKMPNDLLSSVC